MKVILALMLVSLTGCAIHEETIYIGGDLITIKMEDRKPRVRVTTGIDACKWRGRLELDDLGGGDHELWIKCSYPIQL